MRSASEKVLTHVKAVTGCVEISKGANTLAVRAGIHETSMIRRNAMKLRFNPSLDPDFVKNSASVCKPQEIARGPAHLAGHVAFVKNLQHRSLGRCRAERSANRGWHAMSPAFRALSVGQKQLCWHFSSLQQYPHLRPKSIATRRVTG